MKKMYYVLAAIFVFITIFICPLFAMADEFYTYKDAQGNTVIANQPNPERLAAEKEAAKKEKANEKLRCYTHSSNGFHYRFLP